ncbi:MAG: hypothetical protein A3C53_04395 [Omnitrophica WOR_2 bacterium RIFCSPHIGHO2_02_FULL_68_15]|nr:MAG: hypothetical protein A3C53_04395 [Omnitrophica WOR_2 bacterium RIFCSPHIGHO2_02_FULL_68_15]
MDPVNFNPEAIRGWIGSFGTLGPVVYVLLYAVNTVTLLPPIGILSLTAGLAFGPLVGCVAIMAGATLGTSATFVISRRLGRGFVERRLKGRFKSLDDRLERRGFQTVFFFRMVPLVHYEPLNYLSGLSPISFREYAAATFLGLIPGAAAAAFLGDALLTPFSTRFFLVVGAYALYTVVVLAVSSTITRRSDHAAV